MTETPRGAGQIHAMRRWGWLWAAGLFACLAVVLGAGLDALLDPRVPVFGDLGGHVAAIRDLKAALGRGHIHEWSYSWYGGYPLFYFYFPLPALLIAGVSELTGLGPAVTVAVVLGPLLIPVATATLIRATGGSPMAAAIAGFGGAWFVLARSLGLAGGSLESSMVGEYSYALAMALSLFYLATLPTLFRDRARQTGALAALLLAATALSHVLCTAMAVLGSLALVRRSRDFRILAGTWLLAFLVSGWWSLPFLGYAGEMNTLAWAAPTPGRLRAILYEGTPILLLSLVTVSWRSWAGLGGFHRLAAVFVVAGFLPLAVPEPPMYPARLLPYAFWALHVLAISVIRPLAAALHERRHLFRAVAAIVGLTALVGVGALRGLPRWTADAMLRGAHIAADRTSWEHLAAELMGLPSGAVLTAAHFSDPDPGDELYLLNLFAGRQLPHLVGQRVVGGLWQESSPNATFKSLAERHLRGDMSSLLRTFNDREPEVDLGVRQARILGARYAVIAGVPEYLQRLSPAGVEEIARDSLWRLYEIHDFAVAVHPAGITTVSRQQFGALASKWFESGGESPLPVVAGDSAIAYVAPPVPRTVAGESGIVLDPGEIQIGGVQPGRPLLLRLSFFPNWTLASPGKGPFRAAPNHMLVVPETDEVRLIWQYGWLEKAGLWISILGAGLLVVTVLTARPS